MQLTPLNLVFMVGDYAVSVILILLFVYLYRSKRIDKVLFYAFWAGCLIGSVWEFTFMLWGPGFAYSVNPWPFGLSGWPKKLSHSIWDGGIFMVGVWLCQKLIDRRPLFTSFNWRELGIMEIWGVFQGFLVEYLFVGRVWFYVPLPWNPVIIPPLPGGASAVGYTLIPQLVWIIAPVVFYFSLLWLKKRFDSSTGNEHDST
ncbi:hypothetical protein EU546_07345 [Candidatus Thorarchaeota archaeon]|nr:MAG: hypothetical protein EU546_07345 [Candidatus Thorarchaeota archaeon]